MKKKNIFVSIDNPDINESLKIISQIKDSIAGIKIGIEYLSNGPEGVKAISKYNLPIFYDCKFFDIKNSVVKAIKALKNLPSISYLTIHLLNGEETLIDAKKAADELSIKLIGISVLTSFSNENLKNLGFSNTVDTQVQKLTQLAVRTKLHGIVCSAHELNIVKKISSNLVCFTPGIRPSESKIFDQKRIATPKEAMDKGSDYLIIGRPITIGDPKKNIEKIINSIN